MLAACRTDVRINNVSFFVHNGKPATDVLRIRVASLHFLHLGARNPRDLFAIAIDGKSLAIRDTVQFRGAQRGDTTKGSASKCEEAQTSADRR